MLVSRPVLSCFLLCALAASGTQLRSSAAGRSASASQSLTGMLAEAADEMPGAAIKRVIGMLENLVAEMDAEQVADDKQFEEFTAWCAEQQAATQASIESLQTTIEDLTASLAQLYAQKAELEAIIKKLEDEIALTQRQMAQATEKRNEEHQNFVKEQTDFDTSITACHKAIEILKEHYGDGTVEKAEKPSW